METHFNRPLEDIFRSTQRSCRSTRGVVMALARFDFGTGLSYPGSPDRIDHDSSPTNQAIVNRQSSILLSFATIGNIEARVVNSIEPYRFAIRRGIVGRNAPKPVVTQHEWNFNNILVLHSDGLTTHWRWEDFQYLANEPATFMAREMLRKLGKETDDATVVVVKGKREQAVGGGPSAVGSRPVGSKQ